MADITTPAQFRMRRLIRGWKREMEEKRAEERKVVTLDDLFSVEIQPGTTRDVTFTSDNIRISSIRPWRPEDDEPDGAA